MLGWVRICADDCLDVCYIIMMLNLLTNKLQCQCRFIDLTFWNECLIKLNLDNNNHL